MKKKHLHQTHPAIVKRLKRAGGHLRNVIGMIETSRACPDIVQQLQAVEKAIANAKKTLVHDHIDHCLSYAAGPTSGKRHAPSKEFRKVTKYL